MRFGSVLIGRRSALLVGTGLPLAGRRVAAEGQARRLNFEDMAVGAAPSGFDFALTGGGAPVRWAVLEDASSPAGPKVLAETSRKRRLGTLVALG